MILVNLYIASVFKLSKNKFMYNPYDNVRKSVLLEFFKLNLSLIFIPMIIIVFFKTGFIRYLLLMACAFSYWFVYKKIKDLIGNQLSDEFIEKCCEKVNLPTAMLFMYYYVFTMLTLCIVPFFSIWIYSIMK